MYSVVHASPAPHPRARSLAEGFKSAPEVWNTSSIVGGNQKRVVRRTAARVCPVMGPIFQEQSLQGCGLASTRRSVLGLCCAPASRESRKGFNRQLSYRMLYCPWVVPEARLLTKQVSYSPGTTRRLIRHTPTQTRGLRDRRCVTAYRRASISWNTYIGYPGVH